MPRAFWISVFPPRVGHSLQPHSTLITMRCTNSNAWEARCPLRACALANVHHVCACRLLICLYLFYISRTLTWCLGEDANNNKKRCKTRWWHTVRLDFLASGCSIHVWRDGRPLPCARCRSVRTGGHILLLVLRRKIKIETGLALARKQEEKCIFNGGGNGKSNARQCGERGA